MDKPVGENMGAANLYGMLTIIAFILSFPFALYYEGPGFMAAWKASTAVVGAPWLIRQMTLDGFYYYAYNEVSDRTLSPEALARLLCQAPSRTCWSPRARPTCCNLLYCHGHGRHRCRGISMLNHSIHISLQRRRERLSPIFTSAKLSLVAPRNHTQLSTLAWR